MIPKNADDELLARFLDILADSLNHGEEWTEDKLLAASYLVLNVRDVLMDRQAGRQAGRQKIDT